MTKSRVLFMTLSLALLAGCGQAPSPIAASVEPVAASEAEAAGSLSTKVKARFRAFFNKLNATRVAQAIAATNADMVVAGPKAETATTT